MVKGAKTQRRKSVSKSARAGLLIPVARVNSIIKKSGETKRVGGSAPVYASAVLEYLLFELLDVAATTAAAAKRKRITPDDLSVALRSDENLGKLLRCFACYNGDKLRDVCKALLPRPLPEEKKAEAA